MAKLGLLFMVAFCVIQLSLGARLPRETAESTTPSFLADLQSKVGDGLKSAQKELEQTFTKENADKLWSSVRNAGEQLNTQFKDFAKDVQSRYTDLTKDAEKAAN